MHLIEITQVNAENAVTGSLQRHFGPIKVADEGRTLYQNDTKYFDAFNMLTEVLSCCTEMIGAGQQLAAFRLFIILFPPPTCC